MKTYFYIMTLHYGRADYITCSGIVIPSTLGVDEDDLEEIYLAVLKWVKNQIKEVRGYCPPDVAVLFYKLDEIKKS